MQGRSLPAHSIARAIFTSACVPEKGTSEHVLPQRYTGLQRCELGQTKDTTRAFQYSSFVRSALLYLSPGSRGKGSLDGCNGIHA